MAFRVTKAAAASSYKVVQKSEAYKVRTIAGGIKVPAKFEDLADFDDTGLTDKFIIIYDAATDSFKTVDPDVLLSSSVDDGSLPDDFIEEINENLDDIDGGEGF